jgi:GT2 family glycosyltransferase
VSDERQPGNQSRSAGEGATTVDPSLRAGPFPPGLVLTPEARNPIRLAEETVRAFMEGPLPVPPERSRGEARARRRGLVSIVVVTHNNLLFTRMCLASVLADTEDVDFEVIVVDNGSADGTPEFLERVSRMGPRVRFTLNPQNRGFAAATNQGLAMASGQALVLLNNDTIVPPGWLARLTQPLADPAVGLVGPVTNRAGNEAQIDAPYRTFDEFLEVAAQRADSHAGRTFDVPMLTMFCLALSRTAFEQLGPLDERYEVGMFEDDDYSLRAQAAGYRVVCAEDVFVHHFGGASFGELTATGRAGALFQANRQRFEAKWGVSWEPHRRRPNLAYRQLAERVCEIVRASVPADATVIVVSKGDDELLDLGLRRAWHFPQDDEGAYAGYYPADSTEAIIQLERLRDRGGEYLVIPRSALWWLDYYGELRQYLQSRCRLVVHRDDACVIFGLAPERTRPPSGVFTP